MTPREAREQLAVTIEDALDDGWTVYSAPPEGATAPAVVIAPRSPYRVKSTVCDEEVRLTITVLMQRNASSAGLDALDDVCSAIRQAIHIGGVMAYVEAIRDIGLIQEVGGVDYLAAALDVTAEV